MPNRCYITKCKNTNKQGYHLFKFPKRPDILRKWMTAIGRDFIPKKSHVICSAHFLPTDIMEKANASGVLLKNLAVPLLFLENPVSGITPAVESGITSRTEYRTILAMESGTIPAVESGTTPAVESGTTSVMKSGTTPAVECGITHMMESDTISSMKCDTISTPVSAVKNGATIVWRSILKAKDNNTTVLASIPSQRTQSTGDAVKLTMQKPRKVSSTVNLNKLEISSQKKCMWKTIKTLRQKLRRKEEKINLLKNLLKTLRYENKLSNKHLK